MILSRIIDHLRVQNWTAVAIELVIVVLGVFIGMQVSNWNAAQAEKRLGHAYAERLTADLQGNLEAHEAVLDYYRVVLDSVERTNGLLLDARSDARELVIHAYRATEVASAPRKRSTWDEIVSSGDTGLLPRRALEAGLPDYFAGDSMRDTFELLVRSEYRRRVRSTIPLEVQKKIRAGCSDVSNGDSQIIRFMPECVVAVDDRTLADVAEALRADPRIVADLRFQYSMVFSSVGVLSNSARHLRATLAALNGALEPAGEVR